MRELGFAATTFKSAACTIVTNVGPLNSSSIELRPESLATCVRTGRRTPDLVSAARALPCTWPPPIQLLAALLVSTRRPSRRRDSYHVLSDRDRWEKFSRTSEFPKRVVAAGLSLRVEWNQYQCPSFTRRRSCALNATIIVERFIAIAPTLIGGSILQRINIPAAAGMAIRL